MKVLQVVETYADADTQPGDALAWLHHAEKSAVTHPHVLLQSDAVRYAASTQAACVARELTALIELGVAIYVVGDDAAARGIEPRALAAQVHVIARSDVPRLFAEHDQIWLW